MYIGLRPSSSCVKSVSRLNYVLVESWDHNSSEYTKRSILICISVQSNSLSIVRRRRDKPRKRVRDKTRLGQARMPVRHEYNLDTRLKTEDSDRKTRRLPVSQADKVTLSSLAHRITYSIFS